MQGAAHIMMNLDIAINFWLTDSYFRAMKLTLWQVKDMGWLTHSLVSFMQWYNLVFSPFLNTNFVTFYQLMLVVTGFMHEADYGYSIQSTWFDFS